MMLKIGHESPRRELQKLVTNRGISPVVLLTSLAITAGAVACGGGSNGANNTAGNTAAGGAASNGSAAVASPAPTTASTAPTASAGEMAVTATGTHGEDLYDAVKANDWTKASSIMDSLTASSQLLTGGSAAASTEQQQLSAVLDTLHRTIPAHQHAAALEAANRVTYLAAKMTTQYHPSTPAEVLLLDYYGRELEVWSAANNTAKLAQTRTDLQTTWNALRPTVQSRGRGDQAARTDSLVTRIAAAKSPAEYGRLAKPFLDEVDELEKVFTKQ